MANPSRKEGNNNRYCEQIIYLLCHRSSYKRTWGSNYFNVSEKKNYKSLSLRKNLIAYSDGKKNLLQISKAINQPIKKILKEMKLLLKKGVLKIS